MNWSRSAVMSCVYCFAFCEHLVKGSMGDFFRNYIYRRDENYTMQNISNHLTPSEPEIVLMDRDMATRQYSTRHMFVISSML